MNKCLWIGRREFFKGTEITNGEKTIAYVVDDYNYSKSYHVTRDKNRHYYLTELIMGKPVSKVTRMHKSFIESILNIRICVGRTASFAWIEDVRKSTRKGA